MATKQNNTNNSGEVNLLDLFRYLLSKWPWFLLSVLVFVGIAFYRYEKTDKTYAQVATVYIKDPDSKAYSASLDRYDSYINKVNLTNEILRLKSKNLLASVVSLTHSDVSYKVPERLHFKELNILSPVIVSFVDESPSSAYSMVVTPKDQNTVVISDFNHTPGTYSVSLRDTVSVGGVRMTVSPSDFYGKEYMGHDIKVSKIPVDYMVSYYQSCISIRQEESESAILRIGLNDSSPQRAHDVLQTLITLYNDESVREKNQVAVNTEKFITERLEIIQRELDEAEAELERFKISNDLILGVGSAASQYSSDRSRYGAEALDIESELVMARYVKDYLSDPTKDLELIPANTGLSNPAIESQIAQYNSIRLKRNALVADGGESNPIMLEMSSTMHQMKNSIVRTIDAYINDLSVKKSDLESRERAAKNRLSTIPSKERQLLALERQQSIKETLYNFLLNRREENAITRAMVDNNAQIIDDPSGSSFPVAPSRNRILLIGFLLGLAVPAIWFLLRMFMDNKVRTRKEIKDAVSVPFLAEIPVDHEYVKMAKNGDKKVMVKERPEGLTAESFSILRTNLNFVRHEGQPVQVITLTSFNESSGKTFIAANLAMSYKRAGKKVVILDLDIRKATISKLFNCKKIGVTNFLSDPDLTLDDIIQLDNIYGEINVVAAGPVAPNPAELLSDSRLDCLVNELRNKYDIIIVDNVPVGVVADAKISNRVSDATLFVARAGIIDRRQFPDLEDLYNNKELVNMLLVLNGTDNNNLGYNNYGYGYGYGRKYGYGYGSGSSYYGEKKEKTWYEKIFKRSSHHHHNNKTAKK